MALLAFLPVRCEQRGASERQQRDEHCLNRRVVRASHGADLTAQCQRNRVEDVAVLARAIMSRLPMELSGTDATRNVERSGERVLASAADGRASKLGHV